MKKFVFMVVRYNNNKVLLLSADVVVTWDVDGDASTGYCWSSSGDEVD